MRTLELDAKAPVAAASFLRPAAIPALIFAVALLAYVFSDYDRFPGPLGDVPVVGHMRPNAIDWCSGDEVRPHCWYQHYVYLAKALTQGTLDVSKAEMPDYYQDSVTEGGKRYLPFPPGPALLLVPFVAVWGTDFSEVYFSIVLGAVNVVLFWYLLTLLKVTNTTKWLLVPFFAFGTEQFYAATTGTVWFYGHVAAIFFVLLALITLLRNTWPVIPALFLGFAFLSREPTVLAAPVIAYWLLRQRVDVNLWDPLKDLVRFRIVAAWRKLIDVIKTVFRDRPALWRAGSFCAGLVPFVVFFFMYNIARFDGPLETGYHKVYEGYLGINIYSFYRVDFPNAPHFELFDPRNIPLHLYTIFLMPPKFYPDWSVLRPSPYGMSVLLSSPAFIYAFFVKGRTLWKQLCWVSIVAISIPLFLHYSQGWVQFGYRFLLDFAPYLLILTAFGFDSYKSPGGRRVQFCLVGIAVVAGFWGRYWANQFGW